MRMYYVDALKNARAILSSSEYTQAQRKFMEWKEGMAGANEFRLESLVAEANAYFTALGKSSPMVFGAMKVQRKQLSELAMRKRTGIRAVLD